MHFYGLSWSEYRELPADLHRSMTKYREKYINAQSKR